MSDFLQPHKLSRAMLLCPWNFPGRNIGVVHHFLPSGLLDTRMKPCLLCFLTWQVDSLPQHHLGSPVSGFFFPWVLVILTALHQCAFKEVDISSCLGIESPSPDSLLCFWMGQTVMSFGRLPSGVQKWEGLCLGRWLIRPDAWGPGDRPGFFVYRSWWGIREHWNGPGSWAARAGLMLG